MIGRFIIDDRTFMKMPHLFAGCVESNTATTARQVLRAAANCRPDEDGGIGGS